jgi:hypothetical protein
MNDMTGLERTLAFLAGKPVDHPPFHPIIMRWAARYAGVKYRDFCLDSVGKTAVLSGIVAALLIYPAGILADWLHPFRVLLSATVALLLIQSLRLLFLFYDFSPAVSHRLFIGITVIITAATALDQVAFSEWQKRGGAAAYRPPGYLHTLLFTNAPFSNFWAICHWQTLSQNNNFDTSRKTRP